MSDDQQQTAETQQKANGGGERPATPEELEIRARHRQEIARIEAETSTELARLDAERTRRMPVALRMFFDDRLYERSAMIAERMASAQGFTPQHLLGQPGACFAVVSKALAWNLDPFSVAQSTYTVGGRVAYEGRLVQAVMEAGGRLRGGIHASYIGDWSKVEGKFRLDGNKPVRAWKDEDEDGLGIVLRAHLHGEEEPREFTFYLRQCYPRNASTWPTRPKQQLHYNAIRAFASIAAPSLLLGVPFQDDLPDEPTMRDITPKAPPPVDLRAEGIRGGGQMGTNPRAAEPQQQSTGDQPARAEPQVDQPAAQQASQQPGQQQQPTWTVLGKSYVKAGSAANALIKLVADIANEDALDDFGDPEHALGAVVATLPDDHRDRVAEAVQDRRQELAEAGADRGAPPAQQDAQPSPQQPSQPADEAAGPAQQAAAGQPAKNLFPQG